MPRESFEVQRSGPDGSILRSLSSVTGLETTLSTGDSIYQEKRADPRLGLFSTYPSYMEISTPSGLTQIIERTRLTELTNSSPLSMTTETEQWRINGKVMTLNYNNLNKTYSMTSPVGRVSRLIINDQELPTLIEDPGVHPISLSYDSLGRVIRAEQDERIMEWSYNSDGYVEQMINPENQVSSYLYSARGQVVEQTYSDNSRVLFNYDLNENLIGLTPEGRPTHTMSYDGLEQLTQYLPPALNSQNLPTSYNYNLDQQLTRITRPDGRVMNYNYGQQSGRLQEVTTPEGNYVLTPISGDRYASIVSPQGQRINNNYDGKFLSSQTYSGSVIGKVEFTQNNDFLLSRVEVNDALSFNWLYDNDNLLIRAGDQIITRDPSTGFALHTQTGTSQESFGYNGYGEITTYQSTPYSYSLTRDKLGRIIQKTEVTPSGSNQYNYVFDPRGRLSQVLKNGVSEHIYGYDGNSNRISVNGQIVGTYDVQDRLQIYNGTQYIYNLNGDLESKIHSQGQDQFVYDSYGNLTRVDFSSGTRIEYIIDGQGRRVSKSRNGIKESGLLYFNQLKPVAELNADNSIRSFFIYGLNPNVPAYILRNGVRYQIHTDQLGSVRFVVDSSGVVVQELEYDVWGKVIKDTNPGFQPFGFAGGIYDIDTGLVRFGARDYDPEVGRWTSKDPIFFGGGDTNLYGYVLNDPVNFVDPEGKYCVAVAGVSNFIYVVALTARYGQLISQFNNLDGEEGSSQASSGGSGGGSCDSSSNNRERDRLDREIAIIEIELNKYNSPTKFINNAINRCQSYGSKRGR